MLTHLKTQPTLARDIMARRLVTVTPETDVAQAISLLMQHNISGMPVVDGDGEYRGVFSEKCCMRVLCETASLAGEPGTRSPRSRDFMVKKLFCLQPQQDVFEAIGSLLRHQVSGAPVTLPDGSFLGVFSEKTSMSVVLEAAYNGLPTAEVRAFMNIDTGRLIDAETDLLTIARMFIETPYRRLPIIKDGCVQGQISRRDVLRSSRILETIIRYQLREATAPATPGEQSMIFLKAHQQLPSTDVAAFMDTAARTITEEDDLLVIAQIFLTTPYRRLPVIRDGRAIGQVSRRDVLSAIYHLTDPPQHTESQSLYLSAVRDRSETPLN